MNYQLLVLDCDGVMFDTSEANTVYYNYFLEHFGREPMTREQFEFVHAHTIDQALDYLFEGDGEIIRQAYQLRKSIDYGDFLKYLTIEPTLVDLLNQIRPPVKTAIATNRTDTMHHLLKEFGLEGQFDMVVTSLDVTRPKPHPEPLQKILDHFGLGSREALYVGDSVVDARAAAAARMPFAAYRNRGLEATYFIDSLLDLKNYLSGAEN
jgi:HAD superfamily hydrolase (TIGR01549 family)